MKLQHSLIIFTLLTCFLLGESLLAESLNCSDIKVTQKLAKLKNYGNKLKKRTIRLLKTEIDHPSVNSFVNNKIRKSRRLNRSIKSEVNNIELALASCWENRECNDSSIPDEIEFYTNNILLLFKNYKRSLYKFKTLNLLSKDSQLLIKPAKRFRQQSQQVAGKLTDCLLNTTTSNLKVALIGDQGITNNSELVLQLIKDQAADLAIFLGDLAYEESDPNSPMIWESNINNILGPNFPTITVIGNHDRTYWNTTNGYKELLAARKLRMPKVICSGEIGTKELCNFKGLSIVVSGIGTEGSDHNNFIEEQLQTNEAIWKLCAWHKNQQAMQVGGKNNEVGWEVYETCRQNGAIIATGHEHSYSRTKSLVNMQNQTVNPLYPDPNEVFIYPGSTFAFVSGLGGKTIRPQLRCESYSYPYGCNNEWANIQTSNQGTDFGVLFITFNTDSNANQAKGEFIDINNNVLDSFNITTGILN